MTGQKLVEKISAWIRSWVSLSEDQALVCTLWVLNTWVYEKFASTPYLEISASTKRSGKTRLLDTLLLLCRNPKSFATIRTLVVVRMIEAYEGKITVGFDEAERLGQSALGDTRSMLAVGYRAGSTHPVSVGTKFREFSCYCPKLFALIGNLTGILRDRSIPIDLSRGKPARDLQAENEAAKAEAEGLIMDWAGVAESAIQKRIPVVVPDWLEGREQEIWTPLVSLAHALGLHKETMDRLVSASVDMSALKTLPPKAHHSVQDEETADEQDAAAKVLANLREVLKADERFIFSAVAVDRLRAIPSAPWRTFRGAGLNENILAALLSRYGLKTKLNRMERGRTGRVARGYMASQIRGLVETEQA